MCFVEYMCIVHCYFQQPKENFAPPFDGLPLKTVVCCHLVYPVDTHYVLVILMDHLREVLVARKPTIREVLHYVHLHTCGFVLFIGNI